MRRLCGLMLIVSIGCGTTRTTDSSRAATEMLLISQAIDRAVARIDFSPLAGRTVYLDSGYIDNTVVDRGYLISSVRHHLVAHGALLRDDEKAVEYIVELRTGGIGTDRSTMLIGTPQITMPAVVPGMPSSIPEIALYKRNDQKGVAKIGVFAYQRATGRAIWQTEIVQEASRLKDRWLFGSGPYSNGTIRKSAEFAGEELPKLPKLSLLVQEPAPVEPHLLPAVSTCADLGPPVETLGLLGGLGAYAK